MTRHGFCEYLPGGVRIQMLACYACHLGQCPGGWHTWADDDDRAHAIANGRTDPVTEKCGCTCTYSPDPGPSEPGFDDDDLIAPPCPLCGADGACGYDTEGRPMIHCVGSEDDE